jgi:hypothetical protein
MRFERAALFACLCLSAACGGSSTAPAGSGVSTQVVTLTVDGVAMDLSAIARAQQTTAPYLTNIGASNAQSTTNLNIEISAYPPVAGTHSCPTNGVGIDLSVGGVAFYSGVNAVVLTQPTPTSCTITITSYTAAGAPFEGTFSATVASNTPVISTHVITNGHFTLTAP